MKFSIRRILTFLTALLFIGYITLSAIAFLFAEQIIFPYRDSSYGPTLPGLTIHTAEDGTPVASRYWEAPSARHLVLLFHGNYEDIGQLNLIANHIIHLGYSVISMDYRGYGLSGGNPTEKNCYSDARLILNHARSLGFVDSTIILWGRSVGSGPATQLALEINAGALVLESPFTSAFRTFTQLPLLPFDKFNNLAKIDKVSCPLFIMHGANDKTIPSWHSAKLHAQHIHPKVMHLVDNAGHNDLWTKDLRPALLKLKRMVDRYASLPSPSPGTR
ncbi:MAG: alpha/beta hydrolase [Verrucomicrobiaceae bacterium]|nr:alpha/beta hydrolase [Verrucomicrobiaceae bacterium]